MNRLPLSVVRRLVIKICRAIQKKGGFAVTAEDGFQIIESGNPNENDNLRGSIALVQNTMNPDMFGANVLIENHGCEVNGVVGAVDFMVVIPLIEDNPRITNSQIYIESVDAVLNDKCTVDQIIDALVKDWNTD